MSEVAIKFHSVVKRFPGVTALDEINLNIPKGAIVGLLGPNGSGKSTMLKMIAGLTQPTQGMVEVLGQRVTSKLKQEIAFLPEINHFYKWMTIGETLQFWSSFYDDWDQEIAEDLLEFMNLKATAKVKHLSKGMKARLKLIVTLARRAPIVLLDEPFSGIDPQSRGRIMDAITSKYDFGEQTLIISTHDVMEAEHMFDHVILLEYSKLKAFSDADEIREKYGSSIHDMLKEVFE